MARWNYYKSLPGYLSLTANVVLAAGIMMLFINWRVSIPLFMITVVLWSIARNIHKKRTIVSVVEKGFNKSAKLVAKKYRSPEGISELKQNGFSDEEIRSLQELAKDNAEKGLFRKEEEG